MSVKSEEIKDKSLTKSEKPEVKFRAFYLSVSIIKFLEQVPIKPGIKVIIDQLARSVTSIGANIVEAKASASKREFINYFHIALKSAHETKYWLALLRELLPENLSEISKFSSETDEICKILTSSLLTMKGKKL